jgi:hypothetical protein
LVNLRVITMDLPYSFGLYASSPWFLSEMVTSATLCCSYSEFWVRDDLGE